MKRMLLKVFLLGSTACAAFVGTGMPQAMADAYGCHQDVCIEVRGHGDYVGRVTIYESRGPRGYIEGYYYFWENHKIVHRSNYHKLKNESYFHSHRWSSYYDIDRYLPKGMKICGSFAQSSNYEACETVGG